MKKIIPLTRWLLYEKLSHPPESKKIFPKTKLLFALLSFAQFSFSQKADSTKGISHFTGSIGVTNNGISLIPTFSLNDPAVAFNLSIGKGRFSFEPDLRFALEGKPWSFLFWTRYRLQADRFLMTLGAHPALNFKTLVSPTDGSEMIVARRFLAGELAPNYIVSANTTVGMYYLYGHGFDQGTPRNTHFITINSYFRKIRVGNKLVAQAAPQLYYLDQDGVDGLYLTATFALAKKNFPVFIQSIMNKEIESELTGTKSFVWNISLIYSFGKNYVPYK